jgi:alkyl hydroperoxide reductase subunit AhpF
MPILKIYQGRALQAALAEITSPVQVIYTAFDQAEPDTSAALADLKALIPYLSVNVSEDSSLEADRLVVQAEDGRALNFVGAPVGMELAALVAAIVIAGRGHSGLAPETQQALVNLPAPVHLEVFTTPT